MNLFELFVKIGVDDQASKKIDEISQKMGNGLKKAASVGITAITSLGTVAIKNFADFEQLAGGAELMFGDAFETVMDNALMVKSVGSRLRESMNDDDPDSVTFERRAMKSVVDLYVGSSEGVRKGVAAIADINQLLNGPKDDGLSGLTALANVLHSSQAGNTAARGDTLSEEE